MRQSSKAILSTALLCALVLVGCGSSDSPKQVAPIALTSSAITNHVLPARYTCAGRDISPPLEWGAVPAGVGSLVLLVIGLTPNPRTNRYVPSVAWAAAGLNPALHKLAPGRLPRGAYAGVASDGKRSYSICPKKGATTYYEFELYGLTPTVVISPYFAGAPIYNALASPGSSNDALARGRLVAFFKRP